MNKEKITKFHKDNILKAADALFLTRGFEKTTVEMIANAAEYSKPTVYAYFQSKEEIFACNLLRYIKKLKSKILEITEDGERSVTDAYLACCFEIVNLKRDIPIYYSGIMGALDYGRNSLSDGFEIRQISEEINNTLKKLFDRGEKEGLFREGADKESAYAYIWSCVNGIVMSPLLDTEHILGESNRRAVLKEYFLNVIRAYLAH